MHNRLHKAVVSGVGTNCGLGDSMLQRRGPKAENGDGLLGEGSQPPPHQLGGLGAL